MATQPGFYRFKLGAFTGIALHDGTLQRDRPPGFVRNAPDDAVGDAFAGIGLPRDKLTLTFTALAVETGDGVVLIDTGMGEAGPPGTGMLAANLAAAGIRPDDVATVIVSHFHGDHIGGLRRKDGALAFPRARVMVPQPEWDFWMDDARIAAAPEMQRGNAPGVRKVFEGMDVQRFAWGDQVLPSFTAIRASGHTPGMTAIDIVSGAERLLFVADVTNNPLIFARNPTWQAVFDTDPEEAAATRRAMLDQAAAERRLLFFFHAPFPGLAYVARNGGGYEYLPALWTAA